MSGSGKDMSGMVGISRNGSTAGTFPDMKLVAHEIQRWQSMRVLVWPGLRPLSRNPQGAVVDEVEFGSGGLTSIMLAEVGKALARVSFRVLHVVWATSGSYLKSSGSTRIAFGVAGH